MAECKFYHLPVWAAALITFLFAGQINAQFSAFFSVEGYSDDNIYNNYTQVSDFVTSLTADAAYDVYSEQNNFELYYTGSYNFFREYIFKSSTAHRIGLVNTHLFSVDNNPFNAGMNYSFRINRDEFSVYDFNQFSVYANYLHKTGEGDYIQPGYLFRRNSYENFPAFSHTENIFFFRLNSSFESGTSVISGVEYDLKQYIEKSESPELADQQSQLKLTANIAQSLNDNTGLSAYVIYRSILSEGNRYISIDDFVYYEEEVFYDVYSNEGYQAGIKLSALLAQTLLLSIAGEYSAVDFPGLPVADSEGYSLDFFREDERITIGADLQWSLNILLDGLILNAAWTQIRNSSNDYYYDFSNNLFSLALEYEF
ncbi:MAG: hypothetical protein Kow0098_07050 [Ignavibacteriaceae bacterium]